MGILDCATRVCKEILCTKLVCGLYMCNDCQERFKPFLAERTKGKPISRDRFEALTEEFREIDPDLRNADEWLREDRER